MQITANNHSNIRMEISHTNYKWATRAKPGIVSLSDFNSTGSTLLFRREEENFITGQIALRVYSVVDFENSKLSLFPISQNRVISRTKKNPNRLQTACESRDMTMRRTTLVFSYRVSDRASTCRRDAHHWAALCRNYQSIDAAAHSAALPSRRQNIF